ncbi:MAG: serine/threonine protein kinase [Psychroserpens sp.]|jgi:serine/threonine protein kinase
MSVHQRVYNAFVQNKTTQEKLKAISSSSIANRNMIDGNYGSVKKMVLKNNGKNIEYVIKTVANVNKTDKYQYSKHSEYDYLRIMDHPNIIKVYDVFDYKSNPQKKLSNILCTVSEFGGETLYNYIRKSSDLNCSFKSKLFLQICSAAAYISNLGLIHRDLKALNITVQNHNAKIIDFGIMIFKNNNNNNNNGQGTPWYTRGIYNQRRHYGPVNVTRWHQPDNFSLGIILWFIFTQNVPKGKFYTSLQEKGWLDICRQSLKKDEYLNTNDKKETFKVIIDLVIDLIHEKEKLFEIENLKLFCKQFISFNNDTMYNKYKELSIAPQEKVTEISELRKKWLTRLLKSKQLKET